MFELAAYRKANPSGCISLLPLFLPQCVVTCWLWFWILTVGVLIFFSITGTEVGEPDSIWLFSIFLALPAYMLIFFLRRKYREKHQLLLDLSSFELNKLSCEKEFDRSFIFGAVDQWYGSEMAFTTFVKGPLRDELLGMLPRPSLPPTYTSLVVSSLACLLLEVGVSLYHAGAPALLIAIFMISWSAYTLCCIPIAFNLVFYLSDQLAMSSSIVEDVAKNSLGAAAVVAWYAGGVTMATMSCHVETVWVSLGSLIFYLLILLWTFVPRPSDEGRVHTSF